MFSKPFSTITIFITGLVTVQLSRRLLQMQYESKGIPRPLPDVMHSVQIDPDLLAGVRFVFEGLHKILTWTTIVLAGRSGDLQSMSNKLVCLYVLRAVMNVCTLLPPSTSCTHNTNVILDFFRSPNNCGDLMFSGHQAMVVVLMLYLRQKSMVSTHTVWWICILQGMVTSVSRNHYTIDVIVATMAAFLIFHYV